MYSIERALLSTCIQYDLQLNDESSLKLQSFEMYEEDFKDQYFRLIVKTINHLRQLQRPYFMEALAEALQENGIFNEERYLDIISSNILTPNTFSIYYKTLRDKNLKSFHGDI